MIKIYDTMSRDLREFVPIEEGSGACLWANRVHNYIHVGMPVRRWLLIPFVVISNTVAMKLPIFQFTDVDDKIINRAKEEGITPLEVADKYIAAFREDVTALGVKPATRHPRVVEFMADIIRFVEVLIEKGYAYESQGRCLLPRGKNLTTMLNWPIKPWKIWSWVLQVVPMKKRLARKIL